MKFRVSFILFSLATITFFASSILYDFRFFVDSQTYYDNLALSTSWNHKLLVAGPSSVSLYATINFLGLIYFIRKFHCALIWPLFHPYHLMLAFNGTKEQIAFVGIVIVVLISSFMSRVRGVRSRTEVMQAGAGAAGAIFFVIRDVYFPVIAIVMTSRLLDRFNTRSLFATLVLAGAALYYVISQMIETLMWRAENIRVSQHVGRDYFPLLCLDQRQDIISLIPCWAMTNIGIPLHPALLSMQAAVLYSFLICYWWTIWLLTKHGSNSSRLMIIVTVILSLAIFWWSPTIGAYHRYFAPVIWLGILSLLLRHRWRCIPRSLQYRFLGKSIA